MIDIRCKRPGICYREECTRFLELTVKQDDNEIVDFTLGFLYRDSYFHIYYIKAQCPKYGLVEWHHNGRVEFHDVIAKDKSILLSYVSWIKGEMQQIHKPGNICVYYGLQDRTFYPIQN